MVIFYNESQENSLVTLSVIILDSSLQVEMNESKIIYWWDLTFIFNLLFFSKMPIRAQYLLQKITLYHFQKQRFFDSEHIKSKNSVWTLKVIYFMGASPCIICSNNIYHIVLKIKCFFLMYNAKIIENFFISINSRF